MQNNNLKTELQPLLKDTHLIIQKIIFDYDYDKIKSFTEDKDFLIIYLSFFLKFPISFDKKSDQNFFINIHGFLFQEENQPLEFFNYVYEKCISFSNKNGKPNVQKINALLLKTYNNSNITFANLKEYIFETKDLIFEALMTIGNQISDHIEDEDHTYLNKNCKTLEDLNKTFFFEENLLNKIMVFNNQRKTPTLPLYQQLENDVLCKENLKYFLKLKQKKGEFCEIEHIADQFINDFLYSYNYLMLQVVLPELFLYLFSIPLQINGAIYNIDTFDYIGDFLEEPCCNSQDTSDLVNAEELVELIESLVHYSTLKNLDKKDTQLSKLNEYYNIFTQEVCIYILEVISKIPFKDFFLTYLNMVNIDLYSSNLDIDYGYNIKYKHPKDTKLNYKKLYNQNLTDFHDLVYNFQSQVKRTGSPITKDVSFLFYDRDDPMINMIEITTSLIDVPEEHQIEYLRKVFHFGGFICFTDPISKEHTIIHYDRKTTDYFYEKQNILFHSNSSNQLINLQATLKLVSEESPHHSIISDIINPHYQEEG